MHLKTIRNRRRVQAQLDRPVRDATEAEIVLEPDVVLEALVSGEMFATWMTRQYAITELERRREPRPGPFDQAVEDVCVPVTAAIAALDRASQLALVEEPVHSAGMSALRTAHAAYERNVH